jgi:hypothetical protein
MAALTGARADISNTLTAILGLPVPRQSMGRFVDDAMVLVAPGNLPAVYRVCCCRFGTSADSCREWDGQDLARQKQALVRVMCLRLSRNPGTQCEAPLFTTDVTANTQAQNIERAAAARG